VIRSRCLSSMNDSGTPLPLSQMHVLCEQAEEKKAATPSYLSAAQQTAYRIPTRLPTTTRNLTPSPPADDFDFASFFPSAASPPRASPPAHADAAADSWAAQESSFGGGSRNAKFRAASSGPSAPQNPSRSGGNLSEASLRNHDASGSVVRRPAPVYRPPASSGPPSEPPPSQLDGGGSDGDDDDILAMLGIGDSKAPKPANSNATLSMHGASETGGRQRGEVLSRTGSSSSMGSNPAVEPDVKRNICGICKVNKSNYLCQPCRHWGPCTGCVPSAAHRGSLYPRCLRENCRKGCDSLVRVYAR